MTTFLDTLIPVVDACDACQIAYYIGGSIATIAHGVPRTTLDVDIIVELSHAQVDRFVALVDQDFYIQAADIHDAITHRSSFNLVHFASMLKIDMFVAPLRPFDLAKAQRVVEMQLTTTSTRRFRVTSPEDIVLQKLEWYALGGRCQNVSGMIFRGYYASKVHRSILRICTHGPHNSTLTRYLYEHCTMPDYITARWATIQ